MEVYEREIRTVRHTIWVDGDAVESDAGFPVMLRVYTDDDTYEELEAAYDSTRNDYYVRLGSDVTSTFESRVITWAYQIGGQMVESAPEHLAVVKPSITYNQFMTRYPKSIIEEKEFRLVEPVVRKVIETYCNQIFTREDNRSYVITGQNSDSLPLPRQLINLESVVVMDPSIRVDDDGVRTEDAYELMPYITFDENDRWSLRRRTTWPVTRGLTPTSNYRFFKYPTRYRVTGDWGWEMVPEDVTRAAGILVNDYGCQDAKYREKYIANIRAGDWRMEFIATGDETTGNANADMILSRFRNVGLAVI
jgi:hypothetical protein